MENTKDLERNILRNFFEKVSAMDSVDNEVSDSKIVRDTKNQLKVALRGATERCTCAKRSWGGPCEICQASDNELVSLRNFFRVMRTAKKHNMSDSDLQKFLAHKKTIIR